MNGANINLVIAVTVIFVIILVVAVYVSVNILFRGRIWHWLKPDSRPRRWVLICLLASLGTFLIWLSVFVFYPKSLTSRLLTLIFGVVWVGTMFALKWLAGIVDWIYERKGWPLR